MRASMHPKTPDKVRLYYKPTCSKSRTAKDILDASDVPYELIHYMEAPPNYDDLKLIAKVLEGDVRDMMRDKEAEEEGWDGKGSATEHDILKFLSEHPAALQRPIAVRGERAVIARPPDKILLLIDRPERGATRTEGGNLPAHEGGAGPATGENPPPRQYGRPKWD